MLNQFIQLQVFLAQRSSAKKGQSLAEYGLILALIAVVCIAALTFLGQNLSDALNFLGDQIGTTITGA